MAFIKSKQQRRLAPGSRVGAILLPQAGESGKVHQRKMTRYPLQLLAEQELIPLRGLVHFNRQHGGGLAPADEPASQAECQFIYAKRGGSSYQCGTKESSGTQIVASQKHVAIRWHEIPRLRCEQPALVHAPGNGRRKRTDLEAVGR